MPRIVISGASGFLGAHVAALLGSDAEVLALGGRDAGGDISEPSTISKVAAFAPDVVLHLAALTSPDFCEERPDEATRVNVDATSKLARAARASCRRFVYASTDLVFDGESAPYCELDPPTPLSVYARTKLEGERAARRELGERVVVVRVALSYGFRRSVASRPSFAESMLERARAGEASLLFKDQFRTPLYVEDAAASFVRLGALQSAPPTVHLAGPERCSRYEMGRVALEVFGLPLELARPALMKHVRSRATRPKDVSLETRLARELGLHARELHAGMKSMARGRSW